MAFNPKDHITKLKGKDYLEVKWRQVWFRTDHPLGNIETEMLQCEPPVFKATIYTADGQRLGTGHGSATASGNKVWSGREIEKAETAAIGRALANAGYGTQFTAEEEGDNLADAPVEPTTWATAKNIETLYQSAVKNYPSLSKPEFLKAAGIPAWANYEQWAETYKTGKAAGIAIMEALKAPPSTNGNGKSAFSKPADNPPPHANGNAIHGAGPGEGSISQPSMLPDDGGDPVTPNPYSKERSDIPF